MIVILGSDSIFKFSVPDPFFLGLLRLLNTILHIILLNQANVQVLYRGLVIPKTQGEQDSCSEQATMHC